LSEQNKNTEINKETVEHLSELARIRMTDDEIEKMTNELHVITDAIALIQEVGQKDLKATHHPLNLVNALRPDEPKTPLTVEEALSGAPEKEDDKFKVPKILGED